MAVDPARAFRAINIALLTVSDTRGPGDDTSGDILAERIRGAGHALISRAIEKDDVQRICSRLNNWIDDRSVDCVITTGGTGVTGRDVTPEALERVRQSGEGKDIPGFGELFRWQSYQKIASSTIQSRATGGVAGGTYLFALPGSPGACRDGWDGILQYQLDYRFKPCNFVELLPRLQEHERRKAS